MKFALSQLGIYSPFFTDEKQNMRDSITNPRSGKYHATKGEMKTQAYYTFLTLFISQLSI